MSKIKVYRKRKSIYHYNAKALPLGAVRTWAGGKKMKKTESGWVPIKRGVGKKEEEVQDFKIGDRTDKGKVQDIYKDQVKIDGTWYAKKIVKKEQPKEEDKQPTGKKEKGEVDTEKLIRSPKFKNWFGDWEKDPKNASKIVNDEGEPQESSLYSKVLDTNGEPLLVYHGTTHEFEEFTDMFGNIENDLGKGFYFTEDIDDANQNYKSTGPDLTNRIERLAEKIEQEKGTTYDKAKKESEKILKGNQEKVLEVYLNIRNPIILDEGYQGTVFDVHVPTIAEIDGYEPGTSEYDEYIEENPDAEDYDYDSAEGKGIELGDALIRAAGDYDVEGDIWEIKDELMGEAFDGITAKRVYDFLKEKLIAYDDEGNIATNQIIQNVFKDLGYDGVIYQDASKHFGTMDMTPGTRHFIAFNSNQIKSKDAENFDKDSGNIYNQKIYKYNSKRKK